MYQFSKKIFFLLICMNKVHSGEKKSGCLGLLPSSSSLSHLVFGLYLFCLNPFPNIFIRRVVLKFSLIH